MSAPGLFIVGVLVTLIVAAAISLLVYGAVLDGRYAAARKAVAEEVDEVVAEADRDPVVA